MKKPIPTVTANFNVFGIALTTASLTLVNDNIINIIPSKKTAVNAVSHWTPITLTTLNVKNALSPIPEANANGNFAYNPINIVVNPAVKHVAVKTAPLGIPAIPNISGFTAIIYAIAKNVVIPAVTSFLKSVPFSLN